MGLAQGHPPAGRIHCRPVPSLSTPSAKRFSGLGKACLMLRAEILDAQNDKRYGKGMLARDLSDELQRRQERLVRIRQARKEMEAETAAATTRQRQEEAQEARARTAAAREADAPDAEQAEQAIEAAENAGVEPPDLEPLAAEATPRRGLARKDVGTPTRKSQRNFTDPDSHLIQSGGSYLQGITARWRWTATTR